MRSALMFMASVAVVASMARAQADAPTFIRSIEAAHGAGVWRTYPAVEAQMHVEFEGSTIIDGRIIVDTAVDRVRVEQSDGTLLVFDGKDAWVLPPDTAFDRARYHLRMWSRLLASPFELSDPKATVTVLASRTLGVVPYDVARLTFLPEVEGVEPDWHLVYRDVATSRVAAMTFSGAVRVRKDDPHLPVYIVTYHDEVEVEGVTLAAVWRVYRWDPELGMGGEPIGQVRVSQFRFVEPGPETFLRPSGSREDRLSENPS